MSEYIPDPIEIMESNIERMIVNYIDEYTCMACKKKVDYDLYCMSPIGDGPCVCAECAGISHEDEKQLTDSEQGE